MSNTVTRLPNERPGSKRPKAARGHSSCDVILRHHNRITTDVEYYPGANDWIRLDGQYMDTPDGWCYQHEYGAAFEHHVSRGCVLPTGWLPIDELTLETVIEYHDRPIHLMFLVDYVDDDGLDHSGTIRTLSDLHELVLRINRVAGLIEVPVDVDIRRVLDVLQDDDCGFVAYRIAQPLERVEG